MPKSTKYTAKTPDAAGRIAYTAEDDAVWRDLVAQQQPSVDQFAARPYLEGQKTLNLPTDRVPQCVDVTQTLFAIDWLARGPGACIDRVFAVLQNAVRTHVSCRVLYPGQIRL